MTFNEGMQIDTSTTSSSGGGGGGGGRIAIGGGLGGLLIVVVALFLGVDPGSVLPQGGVNQYDTQGVEAPGFDVSQCKTGKDANDILACRIIATGNSVDGVWSQLLKGYTRPKVRLFSDSVQTGCGPATTDVGPFYCPVDKTAYFDTTFFEDVLEKQLGSSGGKLAQEYVVAHEFGHHVQDLLGVLGRAQQGATGSQGNGVRTELQADCYAGVWAHYAAITKQEGTNVTFLEPLTDNDIADAMSAAASVGDDRIQQASTGRVNPESWTHGSAAARQYWFTEGYRTGDPNKCDTFSAQDLHDR
ncbi:MULTISPECIES: neutral zinc metallopeptidase [unclassified Mycobacterium]|uniref:KPN_02809 family neutral zinc metallopeptidase n=1 Tax=unclassified Mycobacterium TaxID=2642494 RepID=UPI0029C627AD|nr:MULTISPECIES: neutral zinc metallopeptidase [unclassified Mycobacterium]